LEGTLQKTEFWGILDEQKSVALAKIKIYRILHATICILRNIREFLIIVENARSEQSVRRVVVGKLPTKNRETLKIAFFGNLLMWIEQAS
jgi:hypothetical protein